MLRINKKVWLRISLLLFLVIGVYYFAFTSHHIIWKLKLILKMVIGELQIFTMVA